MNLIAQLSEKTLQKQRPTSKSTELILNFIWKIHCLIKYKNAIGLLFTFSMCNWMHKKEIIQHIKKRVCWECHTTKRNDSWNRRLLFPSWAFLYVSYIFNETMNRKYMLRYCFVHERLQIACGTFFLQTILVIIRWW